MDKMPVTQSWIEQIFEEQIDWDVDCPNACFVSGEFVNAIAAQHEQEVAEVRKHTWKEAEAHFAPYIEADDASSRLFDQYSEGGGLTPAETLEKVAEVLDNLSNALAEQIDRAVAAEEETKGLRAQVAGIGGALDRLCRAVWYGTDESRSSAYDGAQRVLSGAPKVVARLEGKALKRMDGSLLVMARHDDAIQIYHASDDGHYERGYSTLGEPIEQVMVLVVECLPPGEQLEESEQGKEEREDG